MLMNVMGCGDEEDAKYRRGVRMGYLIAHRLWQSMEQNISIIWRCDAFPLLTPAAFLHPMLCLFDKKKRLFVFKKKGGGGTLALGGG